MLGVAEPRAGVGVGHGHGAHRARPLDGKAAQPEAWVEITELEAIVDHRIRDGRLTPLRFALVHAHATGPYALSLHVTPTTIELACRNADAPGGREAVPGVSSIRPPASSRSRARRATAGAMDAATRHGTLALAPPRTAAREPGRRDRRHRSSSTRPRRRHVRQADVQGRARSSTNGSSRCACPAATRCCMIAPGGQIKLANGTLGFNELSFDVKDERRDERGPLQRRAARSRLDGFTPATLGHPGRRQDRRQDALGDRARRGLAGERPRDGSTARCRCRATAAAADHAARSSFDPTTAARTSTRARRSRSSRAACARELDAARRQHRYRHERRRRRTARTRSTQREPADRIDRRRRQARERARRRSSCATARREYARVSISTPRTSRSASRARSI